MDQPRRFAPPRARKQADNTLVIVLSILLALSVILIVLMIVLYVNRNKVPIAQTAYPQYVTGNDVLAGSGITGSISGPLSKSTYKTAPVSSVKVEKQTEPAKSQPGPSAQTHKVVLASSGPVYLTQDDVVAAIRDKTKSTTVAVVSSRCGACSRLKQMLAESPVDVKLVDVSVLGTLPGDVKARLQSAYIPQFAKLGPNGNVRLGSTGVMPIDAIQEYVAQL